MNTRHIGDFKIQAAEATVKAAEEEVGAAKQQKVGLAAGILGTILGRGKSGDILGAATAITYNVWQSGYSRKDEDDADSYGVAAMSRLGFDPRAAVSMLGKLGGNQSGLAKYLASHPNPESRQKKVTAQINSQKLLDVAKRAGGPRLSYSGGESNIYQPVSYDNTATTPGNFNSSDSEIPIEVVRVGNDRVVLVAVAPLANYAGGNARVIDDDTILVSRGNASVRFSMGSDRATLNGREVSLSSKPVLIDSRVYAPLGSVAAGLGGTATYDASRGAVKVVFDNRGTFLALP
ncbi:hypothetical protein EON80_08915 [bacterium]|nr:MAG: hypothetical protein EON80_08915 [bacterium]